MKKLLLILSLLSPTSECVGCKGDNGGKESEGGEKAVSMDDFPNPPLENHVADYTKWDIRDGKFYFGGEWKFLKTAKPLADFSDPAAVDRVISSLDILRSKYYTSVELNCYWHHFDIDGDGYPDKSLEPLNRLVDAIYEKGMYPCLSVETYAVGGGTIPEGFWKHYPDALAINDKGDKVTDTEYGFGAKVVSIFHAGYRATVHTFIKSLARGVDTRKILYFETTVEPQYMGAIPLCYSEAARSEYHRWREENNITDADSQMPDFFPIPETFVANPVWNRFRAQFLARWINNDAAAYREVAGPKAWVAVDYLDANEKEQYLRVGDSIEFLTHLTAADIIQVNWSWYFPDNKPNQKAYDRVWSVMRDNNRDWVVSEHMTFNGSDFVGYSSQQLETILENTIEQGTRFGWEFVSVTPDSNGTFSLYNNNWSPKRVMAMVDDHWGYWLHRVRTVENEKQ